MAARRALLTLALAASLSAPGPARALAPGSSCESCHAAHPWTGGSCVACHRGDPETTREELAHDHLLRGAAAAWSLPGSPAVTEGARLRERLGCRRCHVTGGAGDRLAVSLDRVVWRRDQEQLRDAIRHPASFMPDLSLTIRQTDRLIAVLLRDADRHGAEQTYLVRFTRDGPASPHPFERICGPCHRALTRLGPMGTGRTGPNLSGLLTAHYPTSDGRRWDRERLARWVRNPRAERPTAIMPPVRVTPAELEEIADVLAPAAGDQPPAAARDLIVPRSRPEDHAMSRSQPVQAGAARAPHAPETEEP